MRLNEKDLIPWILCKNDGEVLCANCTCMAGLGEVCSHAAAIMFALEFTASQENPVSILLFYQVF